MNGPLNSNEETIRGFMLPNSCEQRLTYVRFDHFKEKKWSDGYTRKISYDLYKCSCGKHKVVARHKVRLKQTKSCGCLATETNRAKMRKINALGLGGPNRRPNINNINNVNKTGKCGAIKGKVRCYRDDGTWYYVTPERLEALYYGLEGEVHSLNKQSDPDATEKWFLIDINTVPERQKPVLELLRKGWRQKEIAKYLKLNVDIIYQWTRKWRLSERVKWSKPKYA